MTTTWADRLRPPRTVELIPYWSAFMLDNPVRRFVTNPRRTVQHLALTVADNWHDVVRFRRPPTPV
ncbi:hypothetical protein [Mycolicibacterium sp. 624]|uniref:hypothetical protein n=1 Tax=Mycolicibacterium sp. 624 TaxID=3156314 RepID=UPI00339469CB